jgi:carbamoyl-phosphate synthase small subunit
VSAPALLVLEDGRTFRGEAYGASGEAFGEAVFSTGMTGYQETLTDPSYHRQVVVMTAPHVGNTGVNDEDAESDRIWASGYVVRDPARQVSSWRARRSLEDELVAHGVVGVSGIDTRALTRHLRERGAMRVGLSSVEADPAALLRRVLDQPTMEGADLCGEVSTPVSYVVPAVGPRRFTVAALDLGIKRMTPVRLAERGIEVHVLPAGTTPAELAALSSDGLFLSNGPGDPATALGAVRLARAALTAGMPVFGICFGHQVLGRALGFGTYKLRYGHRGINQPVLERATGRVEVTAHNHGFAVDAPTNATLDAGTGATTGGVTPTEFGAVEVSHVCLNDGVVEGLRCRDVPAFSVQYHPEAAAGPHDAAHLFDRFTELMERRGAERGTSEATSATKSMERRGAQRGTPLAASHGALRLASGPDVDHSAPVDESQAHGEGPRARDRAGRREGAR